MSVTNLEAQRADQAIRVRQIRLEAACAALRACELNHVANALGLAPRVQIESARWHVFERRRVNSDGRNEAMYAATGAALEALGRLWAAL